MTVDEAIAIIRERGFVAQRRPELGSDCILAAKQTYVPEDDFNVLDPTRFIERDGSGWAVLEAAGQVPRTFIPAHFKRVPFPTLDDAVAAVVRLLEAA